MELTKHRRTYTLGGARLQLGRSLRHGSIDTAGTTWPVEVVSFRKLAVTTGAGAPGDTVTGGAGGTVTLCPSGAVLPDGPARWEVSRKSVSVVRNGARIDVREEGHFRKTTTVEVTGAWADRDLVVLTAAFALLARQRRRRMIMMMAAANNHGGAGY